MRHIPIAFNVLGILATLYVLALTFDAKTRRLRAASRPQPRITLHEPSRATYSLLASADMNPHRSCFDPAYIRWRTEFVPFEARCFGALCEFVRVQFDTLLDRYYWKGHESLNGFPAWAFERYLRAAELTGAGEEVRRSVKARTFLSNKRSDRRGRL